MSFKSLFKTNNLQQNEQSDQYVNESNKYEMIVEESDGDRAVELLRKEGMKIKLVTKTSFGIQIDLAKQYDQQLIKDVLANFDIKIKQQSVFVVY